MVAFQGTPHTFTVTYQACAQGCDRNTASPPICSGFSWTNNTGGTGSCFLGTDECADENRTTTASGTTVYMTMPKPRPYYPYWGVRQRCRAESRINPSHFTNKSLLQCSVQCTATSRCRGFEYIPQYNNGSYCELVDESCFTSHDFTWMIDLQVYMDVARSPPPPLPPPFPPPKPPSPPPPSPPPMKYDSQTYMAAKGGESIAVTAPSLRLSLNGLAPVGNIKLYRGSTYTFTHSVAHPIRFTSRLGVYDETPYTANVTVSTTQITITVTSRTPWELEMYCSNHPRTMRALVDINNPTPVRPPPPQSPSKLKSPMASTVGAAVGGSVAGLIVVAAIASSVYFGITAKKIKKKQRHVPPPTQSEDLLL